MGTPLQTIDIRGFRSIQALDHFQLNDLNVLIGANGAGKSNFISFFRMLSELVEGRLQLHVAKQGGADRILSFGVQVTKTLEFYLLFGPNGFKTTLDPTANDGFVFSAEEMYFAGDSGPVIRKLGTGHQESLLKSTKQLIARYCYDAISSWRIYHFHDTSDTAPVKRLGSLHDNDYLRQDASNLAAYLYQLATDSPESYQQIRNTVQLAIPFFDDFVLKPIKLQSEEEQIRLLWRQQDSDYPFWPSQLSDGSLRFICLVTALLQPKPPSTIIIDEPELGLHPYAITLLGSLLKSASKRMQVIVSTQSVPLVNEFSIADLIVVERENAASVFKRCDEAAFKIWLEEYSVGELWEKNILGGRPPR